LRKFNRRVLEALIRAGAFDDFDDNRAAHLAELPTALRVAEQHGKMAKTGQNDLFSLPSEEAALGEDLGIAGAYASAVEPWSDNERLAAEKLTLGLFLTGHPIDQYEPELKHFTHGKIASLQVSRGSVEARVAGLVVEVRTRQTKNGKTMGFATLDDKSGRLECAAFGDVYEKYKGIFTRDSLLIAEGGLAIDNFSGALRLTVEKLYDINQARESFSRGIQLTWNATENKQESASLIDQLAEVLSPFKGGSCPVSISYTSTEARASVQLGDEWRIHPTDELLARLRLVFGATAVEIRYR
jgi:DNA polymerase-3 subunit alpha